MTHCNLEKLNRFITDHYAGGLCSGTGDGEHTACILQAAALCEGLDLTDDPAILNRPDIRRLNDGLWSSNTLRAAHMTRLYVALEPWSSWSEAERRAYTERVIVATVRELIADLPGLPAEVAAACRNAATLAEAAGAAAWAAGAAGAAAEAAAEAAAWAAGAAARAAGAAWAAGAAARAARAAGAAARAAVLIRAVDLWIEAIHA